MSPAEPWCDSTAVRLRLCAYFNSHRALCVSTLSLYTLLLMIMHSGMLRYLNHISGQASAPRALLLPDFVQQAGRTCNHVLAGGCAPIRTGSPCWVHSASSSAMSSPAMWDRQAHQASVL